MAAHIETERRFLIARPDEAALARIEGCAFTDITQTYLLNDQGETDRVRKREGNGECRYIRTRKTRVSRMSSIEKEEALTKEQYDALLEKADPARRPIEKRRYVLPANDFLFEIDLYPFWKKQAIMEVELPGEDTLFTIPGEIRVLREITGQKEYSNASLAKQIPEEDD